MSGDSQSFRIRPDAGYHLDSLIVDGEYSGTDTSYAFGPVYQDHTIAAKFSDGSIAMNSGVADNWNLLSVPLNVPDSHTSVLYPAAASPAFGYAGAYVREDMLRSGSGFWLKFVGAQTVSVTGKRFDIDTVGVNEGWNLIGSISSAIPVSGIVSLPPGIGTSNFFGYEQGYKTVDTLRPGYGYWVKLYQRGQLVLSSQNSPQAADRIRIASRGESPPAPPERDNARLEAPREYQLAAAFPNPFNPTAIIHIELPGKSHVSLKLYNLLGQEVQTILDEDRSAGRYDVQIDGSLLPSGVYIYRMIANEFVRSEKVVLLK